jgi:hypothetical protein
VGRIAPSHERGFQKSSRALALSACSSRLFIPRAGWSPGPWPCVVKLALLLEARAGVALTQFVIGTAVISTHAGP